MSSNSAGSSATASGGSKAAVTHEPVTTFTTAVLRIPAVAAVSKNLNKDPADPINVETDDFEVCML